jgi:putative ABC transport system ATP-binding protein
MCFSRLAVTIALAAIVLPCGSQALQLTADDVVIRVLDILAPGEFRAQYLFTNFRTDGTQSAYTINVLAKDRNLLHLTFIAPAREAGRQILNKNGEIWSFLPDSRKVIRLADRESLASGDFITITGPSGSGKSTLLNIIGFLEPRSSGDFFFEGKAMNVTDFNTLARLRSQKIGFIFQSFNLIPVLSGRENVMVPLLIRPDVPKKDRRERVDNLLQSLGLAERSDQRPDELSGGEKQRVAVARALVTNPVLVLADEPTANLDTENSEKILQSMRRMNEERGTTFIFSTHDGRIEKYAKRKIRLIDGQIESGR